MCGIFGYVGKNNKPAGFILDGLKTLEYRGYDSWGLVVLSGNKLKRERHVGKIGEAKTILPATTTGMGHTRWATHGGVTVKNAHPHFDCGGRFAVVHNGIIENERELRKELIKKGHRFSSETDTEIIAHLLEEVGADSRHDDESRVSTRLSGKLLLDLVRAVVGRLEGAFAIGVMDRNRPQELVLARMGGPLVVGMVDGYKLFASDPSALLPFTKKVVYLQDRELAWITPENVEIRSFENHRKMPDVTTLDWNVEKAKKGGYPHFMLKEIMEQPLSLTDTLRGRIKPDGSVKLGGLEAVKSQLRHMLFIRFIGAGTASFAACYGSLVVQELTKIVAVSQPAYEFSYNPANWPNAGSAAWFISQSGETTDVLQSIERVKKEGVLPLGLVNVVGSSLSRRTTAGVYLHAGPEMAVASTKAFTSQMAALLMIACWLAQNQDDAGDLETASRKVAKELLKLPKLAEKTLSLRPRIKKLARKVVTNDFISFFGRGVGYPIALEAALKLNEVAYFNCIGLPTGELKHGPIAAMDRRRPAAVLAPFDRLWQKNRSNIQELRARDIPVYLITDKMSKKKLGDLADEVIAVPDAHWLIKPILLAMVVQLLSYEAGVLLKRPIDKPRNLAKSVTVE